MWKYREQLSYYEKLRRSIYEILRDSLERRLMKVSLIDSFNNYQEKGVEYIFVDKSELKPKSKKMEKESEFFNTFLVIICEGILSSELKNYIRFFPENSVIKKNLQYLPRRTAGLIAAQLLKKSGFISTVFVSSSESRIMYRYSERGVSKFFLIRFNNKQLTSLARSYDLTPDFLRDHYLFPGKGHYLGILEAAYDHTAHSRPPNDGKLRKVRAAYNWLSLRDELLHPTLDSSHVTPIRFNWVYSVDD